MLDVHMRVRANILLENVQHNDAHISVSITMSMEYRLVVLNLFRSVQQAHSTFHSISLQLSRDGFEY